MEARDYEKSRKKRSRYKYYIAYMRDTGTLPFITFVYTFGIFKFLKRLIALSTFQTQPGRLEKLPVKHNRTIPMAGMIVTSQVEEGFLSTQSSILLCCHKAYPRHVCTQSFRLSDIRQIPKVEQNANRQVVY
jgi:hypothetical protein